MLEHMKISNELLGFVLCYSLFSKPNACWVIAISLQKQGCCFNHRVVTMVADKLERQWL